MENVDAKYGCIGIIVVFVLAIWGLVALTNELKWNRAVEDIRNGKTVVSIMASQKEEFMRQHPDWHVVTNIVTRAGSEYVMEKNK